MTTLRVVHLRIALDETYTQSFESKVVIVPSLHFASTTRQQCIGETDQSDRTTNLLSVWRGGYGSVLFGTSVCLVVAMVVVAAERFQRKL